jgi:hypothetical protein
VQHIGSASRLWGVSRVADDDDGVVPCPSSDPSFEEWVDAHSDALTRFAVLVLGDRVAADDLAESCAPGLAAAEPTVERLTSAQAERVRIGLHAIDGGMVDCSGSSDHTYTAVVEDKTGTRRAVTILDSECSTIIRSDGGQGLGFAWLDR